MRRLHTDGRAHEPADTDLSAGSSLPGRYTPRAAGYARGPWLYPTLVTPTDWVWRGARTYVVRHTDGKDYRAIRVCSEDGDFIGYWAVELLGTPLTIEG